MVVTKMLPGARAVSCASGNFEDRFAFNQIQSQDGVMAPKRKRAQRDVPDSLSKDDNRTDILLAKARARKKKGSVKTQEIEGKEDTGFGLCVVRKLFVGAKRISLRAERWTIHLDRRRAK